MTTVEDAERRQEAAPGAAIRERIAAALDELLAHEAVIGRQVGVIGFSMGGYFALWLSQVREEIAAVVVFYSTGEGDFSGSHGAYLGHFAPGDDWEPDEGVDALEESVRRSGREVRFHRCDGAKHWFFEPDRPEYDANASELAWQRTISFLRENLDPLGA